MIDGGGSLGSKHVTSANVGHRCKSPRSIGAMKTISGTFSFDDW